MSSFFDIESYDEVSPVRTYLEDSFISLRPTDCAVQTIFLKKNILKLDDKILGLFNKVKEDYFY